MSFSENLNCRASSLGPIYCEVRAFKPEPRLVPPLGNTSRISLVALINLQVVLPIPIDAKLYKNLVNDDDITIGKLAFIGNTFVGGITARFESSPSAKKLYIIPSDASLSFVDGVSLRSFSTTCCRRPRTGPSRSLPPSFTSTSATTKPSASTQSSASKSSRLKRTSTEGFLTKRKEHSSQPMLWSWKRDFRHKPVLVSEPERA